MNKISKAQISLVNSLKIKKFRLKEKLFIVEGKKLVEEVLNSDLNIKSIFAISEWIAENYSNYEKFKDLIFETTPEIMQKISSFKTYSSVMALANFPENKEISYSKNDFYLALNEIQDPGNFGTILRTCDWFGINNVICSHNCVDLFSPKTLQATMGAFLRINVVYADLASQILKYKEETNNLVFGTFLNGENIYKFPLPKSGMVIMGNEGQGIKKELETLIDKKLFIPNFSNSETYSESLNVAIASAIICSEFKRRII